MPHSSEYWCLERYLGRCGIDPECTNNLLNARCDRFYPCHIVGNDAIVPTPWRAREIQAGLLKRLADLQSPPKPAPVLVDPSAE